MNRINKNKIYYITSKTQYKMDQTGDLNTINLELPLMYFNLH